MNQELKSRILSNTFVDSVRISMKFDQTAYEELVTSLDHLSSELSGKDSIDRELMLSLYATPTMIRNAYLSFKEHTNPPEIANQLEDAWVELDELVTNCLA